MSHSPFTDRFGSQHTLKPVYFSIEVLERYFDDPKYLVFYSDYRDSICLKDEYATDDDYEYIRDFGLAYKQDDTNERAVVTFFGDMLKLPYKAQCYWFSYLLDPLKLCASALRAGHRFICVHANIHPIRIPLYHVAVEANLCGQRMRSGSLPSPPARKSTVRSSWCGIIGMTALCIRLRGWLLDRMEVQPSEAQ